MSWDAYLTDDRGHSEGDWNYTHNTSVMIYAVLNEAKPGFLLDVAARKYADSDRYVIENWRKPDERRVLFRDRPAAWWDALDGMSGPEGAAYLDTIIKGLEADPERFRAMNPENGWGDYDRLVKVLTEMRNAVPEWPTTWGASG